MKHLKDPNELFDFTLHAFRWLGTRTLTTVTWDLVRLSGSGALTIFSQAIVAAGKDANVVLTGGTAEDIWDVTAHLTASDGKTHDHTTQVRIKQTG